MTDETTKQDNVTAEQAKEAKEAKEAIRIISSFCKLISVRDCEDGKRPIGFWCYRERKKFLPEEWEVD